MAQMAAQLQRKPQYSMNPQKFLLWIFLVTVTMLFAAFTSAMIVGREDAMATGKWKLYDIPFEFTLSTIIIVLSSASMQWAYFSATRNEVTQNRRALWITFILGIAFVYMQFLGYKAFTANELYLDSSRGIGFFYVISGMHLLHIIGGIFIIAATLLSSYKFRVHSKNLLRINLCTTYWHFIGVLWVYLFALLSMFR